MPPTTAILSSPTRPTIGQYLTVLILPTLVHTPPTRQWTSSVTTNPVTPPTTTTSEPMVERVESLTGGVVRGRHVCLVEGVSVCPVERRTVREEV